MASAAVQIAAVAVDESLTESPPQVPVNGGLNSRQRVCSVGRHPEATFPVAREMQWACGRRLRTGDGESGEQCCEPGNLSCARKRLDAVWRQTHHMVLASIFPLKQSCRDGAARCHTNLAQDVIVGVPAPPGGGAGRQHGVVNMQPVELVCVAVADGLVEGLVSVHVDVP